MILDDHPSDPLYAPDGTAVSAVDWLGNRFYVGDTVLYCVSAGRGQMMALGVVEKITAAERTRVLGREPEPGETPTHSYTSITGQTHYSVRYRQSYHEFTITVRTAGTSGHWNNKPRTRSAQVNPMNITALAGIEQAARRRWLACHPEAEPECTPSTG